MGNLGRVKGVYGGPVGKKLDIPVTRELLEKLGKCLVAAFVKEARKDFAKRGWSGEARDGSPPIWESFSFKIRGEKTLEVMSTFPDIEVLVSRDIPPRKMTWLTQEAKNKNPAAYPLTKRELRAGKKRGGRVLDGGRLPLVVPLKGEGGRVIFRTAPLKTQDAWIHPGIARFTFAQRAVRSGKKGCMEIIRQETVKALVSGALG
jgi:hypothetical protein